MTVVDTQNCCCSLYRFLYTLKHHHYYCHQDCHRFSTTLTFQVLQRQLTPSPSQNKTLSGSRHGASKVEIAPISCCSSLFRCVVVVAVGICVNLLRGSLLSFAQTLATSQDHHFQDANLASQTQFFEEYTLTFL